MTSDLLTAVLKLLDASSAERSARAHAQARTAPATPHAAPGEAPPRAGVAVVTGPIGAGKTTAVQVLARELAERVIRVGGIVAPRVVQDGETVGYDVVDLASHRSMVLARLSPPGRPVGRFYLTDEGLRFAGDAILRGLGSADVVCVDEVGHAELAGGGHAPAVRLLLGAPVVSVLVVREHLVQDAVAAFGLAGATIVNVAGANRPGQ